MPTTRLKILLCLPLSGKYNDLGQTIQAGLEAALSEQAEGTRPVILTMDSETLATQSGLDELKTTQADICIGPLLKPDIEPLLTALPPRVPVLLLNTLTESQLLRLNDNRAIWQFGLRPEDEAQTVAQILTQQHLLSGIALGLKNDWAQRGRTSFAAAFKTLEGRLVTDADIDPDKTDLTAFLRQALGVEQSTRRKDAIAKIVGLKLTSTARASDQVQFVFLSGPVLLGVQLRSQLKYLYAENIPMVALSDINSDNPLANADLSGVYFTDMPWMIQSLEAIQKRRLSLQNSRFSGWINKRLFAMGLDAYLLAQELTQQIGQKTNSQSRGPWGPMSLTGVTGQLGLLTDGRIQRSTALARFAEDGTVEGVPGF